METKGVFFNLDYLLQNLSKGDDAAVHIPNPTQHFNALEIY